MFIVNNTISNVFDEMYLSVKAPRSSDASFYFMREVGRLAQDRAHDNYDFYMGVYKNSLNEGESISLSLSLDTEIIRVWGGIETENNYQIYYTYEYNFKTKTLEIKPVRIWAYNSDKLGFEERIDDPTQISAFLREHSISRADLERHRDYFLYEKFLTDWTQGNGEHSLFSAGNYGKFTIIDNTLEGL